MSEVTFSFYRGDTNTISPTYTDITSGVLSADLGFGRRSFVDQYAGNEYQIVIRNNAGQADLFSINSAFKVRATFPSMGGQYIDFAVGRVIEIQYNDAKGDGALSTATITVEDLLALLSRLRVSNRSISAATAKTQLLTFNAPYWGGSGPIDQFQMRFASGYFYTDTQYTMAASLYTGTILSYVQQAMYSEGGVLEAGTFSVKVCSGKEPVGEYRTDLQFERSTGQYHLVYDKFVRRTLGDTYANTVTVTPNGIADQTATDATAVSLYGERTYSRSTIQSNASDGAALAEALRRFMSKQSNLLYEIEASVEGQTEWTEPAPSPGDPDVTIHPFYRLLVNWLLVGGGRSCDLVWRVPGSGTDTITRVYAEGMRLNIQPKKSRVTLFLTPLTAYSAFFNFTLDSYTNGRLDQDYLG